MTSSLFHSAEPVPDSGGLSANGVLKLLGQPPFSPLTLLVREAVQNSWDARTPGVVTIGFEIHGQRIQGTKLETLRGLFSSTSLRQMSLLRRLLASDSIDAVEIRDFGTVGLNGPTLASDPRSPRRFVNFIRNIGVEKGADEAGSGGTYGFGKGSYYRLSSAHTVAVHTRTYDADSRPCSRLVITALGDAFTEGDRSFTGRHFFGIPATHTANPLEGAEADEIAEKLNFGVPTGQTGTAILILGFSPGSSDQTEESLEQIDLEIALRCMMEQVIWQCWPKLVDFGDGPEVKFRVTLEGNELATSKWQDAPIFENLISQYVRCIEGSGIRISHRTQRTELGTLSTDKFILDDRAFLGHESVIGFDVPTNHVAFIRKPHLVVKYHEGPSIASPDIGWNGVFLVADDDNVDKSFASAEPPSHDDWIYKNVQGVSRNFVKHALNKIDEALRSNYAETIRIAESAGEVSALAGLLGGLLGLVGFDSGEVEPDNPSGRTRLSNGPRGKKFDPSFVNIVMKDGQPVCEAVFLRQNLPTGVSLKILVKTAIDADSSTDDLPGDFRSPEISEWRIEVGSKRLSGGDHLLPAKLLKFGDGKITIVSPLVEGRASVIQLASVIA